MRVRPFLRALALAASLAGCTAAPASPTESVDPHGAATVPRLREAPTLDETMGAEEWADAREVRGQFVIRDGSPAEGTYDFTLKLGVTDRGLHLAIHVPAFPANPWNSDRATYSDCVVLFFTGDHPAISRPSFSVGACPGVSGYSTTHPGFWTGADWAIDGSPESGAFNGGRPTGGTWARGSLRDGALTIEFSTMRFPTQTEENGLRLEDGTAFRLSLLLMRLGGDEPGARSPDARGAFTGPHDAFPGDGYTPHAHYDAAGWLRLRVEG